MKISFLASISWLCGLSVASAIPTVFINEIHYSNAGGDVGEMVELAGTSGIDLTDWDLLFYNGSNGTVYDTVNLSGTFGNQQAGFGTLSFLNSGIQNGAPDGIALIDNFGIVVQFLSYEGSLTATNGAANGLTSTDIGVSETDTSTTPVGVSLQLTGVGSMASDFAWAAPMANTAGNINTDQQFVSVPDSGATLGLLTLAIVVFSIPLYRRIDCR